MRNLIDLQRNSFKSPPSIPLAVHLAAHGKQRLWYFPFLLLVAITLNACSAGQPSPAPEAAAPALAPQQVSQPATTAIEIEAATVPDEPPAAAQETTVEATATPITPPTATTLVITASATLPAATVLTQTTPEDASSVVEMPTVTPLPASTPLPSATAIAAVTYEVKAGDTLTAIAAAYGTTAGAVQQANNLPSDLIQVGQILLIPAAPVPLLPDTPEVDVADSGEQPPARPTVQPPSNPATDLYAAAVGLSPAILEGDLAAAYPLEVDAGRFTLHLTPHSYPAKDPQAVVVIVEQALAFAESHWQTTLAHNFDLYMAGTLFAAPNQPLRGLSSSANLRFFVLNDGTGHVDDLRYSVAHELTHLFAWNTFGRPSSVMLSEGAAVYTGMSFVDGSRHLPLVQFCAAYQQAGMLPQISAELRYQGHIRNLENYYAAGCFVEYLVETYGARSFAQLYPTSDYRGIYGKSLVALEAEWRENLASRTNPLPFAPAELVEAVNLVKNAYEELFAGFDRSADDFATYQALDTIRIALLEGRVTEVLAYFATH